MRHKFFVTCVTCLVLTGTFTNYVRGVKNSSRIAAAPTPTTHRDRRIKTKTPSHRHLTAAQRKAQAAFIKSLARGSIARHKIAKRYMRDAVQKFLAESAARSATPSRCMMAPPTAAPRSARAAIVQHGGARRQVAHRQVSGDEAFEMLQRMSHGAPPAAAMEHGAAGVAGMAGGGFRRRARRIVHDVGAAVTRAAGSIADHAAAATRILRQADGLVDLIPGDFAERSRQRAGNIAPPVPADHWFEVLQDLEQNPSDSAALTANGLGGLVGFIRGRSLPRRLANFKRQLQTQSEESLRSLAHLAIRSILGGLEEVANFLDDPQRVEVAKRRLEVAAVVLGVIGGVMIIIPEPTVAIIGGCIAVVAVSLPAVQLTMESTAFKRRVKKTIHRLEVLEMCLDSHGPLVAGVNVMTAALQARLSSA